MITNKDLEIENISYTDKDFGQIYPELLELVKKLTNKWDPETTNESDPGIVLLKLVAFLGDKLNYNIDKNTLEQFMDSATQEISMRRLTEMMGYNMKYYRAATTRLSFRYLGELGNPEASGDILAQQSKFYIRAFDTTFKTEDDITYTLIEDFYIDKSSRVSTGKLAIQGQLKTLSVLGSDNYTNSTLIQLYNLDDQNRVYFPDLEVAENGIFINKEKYDAIVNPDAWHRVDSLNDQELGLKVFKFGFDSNKSSPYIEFPTDIADLIDDGLEICYIVTSGENGKVTNNKLSSFNSLKITDTNTRDATELLTSLDESTYLLTNSSSTEAYNPETLTEAYNNFKKVVGTFNTLVACRDYSNYINRYEDDDLEHVVSNVVATDVRTDPYYTKRTFVRNSQGASYYENVPVDESTIAEACYNLILHGTMPVNQDIQTLNQYEKTYRLLTDANIQDIKLVVSDVKTINHILKKPADGSLALIEADYILKANISTKYKVNATEQKQIVDNIKKALFENFNARQVEFGEEIPYESLVNVIKSSDTRIKNVSLDDPDIEYYVVKSGMMSGTEKTKFIPAQDLDIIVDNVRAGALPFYKENNEFSYDYLMDLSAGAQVVTKLSAIYASLDVAQGDTLRNNETVQLVEDSYKTDVIYPAYVYYAFYTSRVDPGLIAIHTDETYKLKENETLYIHYTDSTDTKKYITYEEGDIIRPNFDIVNTSGIAQITTPNIKVEKTVASKFINWSERLTLNDVTYRNYTPAGNPGVIPLFAIGTNEQINILTRNEVKLPSNSDAFWYIKPKVKSPTDWQGSSDNPVENERGNIIFTEDPYNSGKFFYILEEGELFIYPNSDMTSLNILGAGTKLEYPVNQLDRSNNDIIDLNELEESIENEDLGTFKKAFNWQRVPQELTIVESTVTSFTVDDIVDSFTLDDSDNTITSNWKKVNKLTVNNTVITISDETKPLIRSVLSITASNTNPQEVLSGQHIYLYTSDIEEEEDTTPPHFAVISCDTNGFDVGSYLQVSPGLDSYNNLTVLQDLLYTEVDGVLKPVIASGKYLHTFKDYSLINYTLEDTTTAIGQENTVTNLVKYLIQNNRLVLNGRDEYLVSKTDLKAFFDRDGVIVPPYKLTITSGVSNLYFNIFDSVSEKTTLYETPTITDPLTPIEIDVSDFIENGAATSTLYITKPKQLSIYNYLVESGIAQDVKDELLTIERYDWLGTKNMSKMIDSYTPLYSFFNENNIYNKFTLPKIDFDESEFNIVGSSRL